MASSQQDACNVQPLMATGRGWLAGEGPTFDQAAEPARTALGCEREDTKAGQRECVTCKVRLPEQVAAVRTSGRDQSGRLSSARIHPAACAHARASTRRGTCRPAGPRHLSRTRAAPPILAAFPSAHATPAHLSPTPRARAQALNLSSLGTCDGPRGASAPGHAERPATRPFRASAPRLQPLSRSGPRAGAPGGGAIWPGGGGWAGGVGHIMGMMEVEV